MNPILPFILNDDKKDADTNGSDDSDDEVVENHPTEGVRRSSLPLPISESQSAATIDEKKYDCKDENCETSSTIVHPTHLSRQNTRGTIQPGAFSVSPTRVRRLHAHRRRASDEDEFEDIDIESNTSSCNRSENRENSNITGLIQAELVTAPSPTSVPNSLQMLSLGSIQRAEVVEPFDPSLIKKQLEAQQQKESKHNCFGIAGMKYAILVMLFAMVIVAIYIGFELEPFRHGDGTDTEPPTTVHSSSYEMRPPCTGDTLTRLCFEIRHMASMMDDRKRSELQERFNCSIIDSDMESTCEDRANHDTSCLDEADNLTLDQLCLLVVQKIVDHEEKIMYFTDSEALQIAGNCTDEGEVCYLWEHLQLPNGQGKS